MDGARMRLTCVKVLVISAAVAAIVAGQTIEPEMSADRPGFRNSTHLVGPGVVQFENGVVLSRGADLALQSEFRLGIFRWLELRLVADEIVLRPGGGSTRAGISDLQPGIKFPVFDRIAGTRVVAILKSTVPSGHGSQSTGGYEPGAELIWERKLTEEFSLAGTWNLTRLKQERVVWQRAASVSANNSFSDHLRAFAEAYVVSPRELGTGNQWVVDAGLMGVIGRHVMVDAAAGHSIHGPSEWFLTVGLHFVQECRDAPGLPINDICNALNAT
jgi:hypothetical protein